MHNSRSVIQSTMTSEQLFNQIAEKIMAKNELNGNNGILKIKGCPMHPKPSNRCRKCNEIIE